MGGKTRHASVLHTSDRSALDDCYNIQLSGAASENVDLFPRSLRWRGSVKFCLVVGRPSRWGGGVGKFGFCLVVGRPSRGGGVGKFGFCLIVGRPSRGGG